MQTKQDIIVAIRQTAKENAGKPLGERRFSDATGIKPYDWKKFWPRFGDAQKEAGFIPNTLTPAHTDDFLFGKIIGLMRKLGKFPAHGALRVEKSKDPDFPYSGCFFQTKEQKRELVAKIIEWCKGKKGTDDIIGFCAPVLEESSNREDFDVTETISEVYLFKSGRFYKIGKTKDTVQRGKELRIQLPETCHLVHSIKTDDPNGVEVYWHKRFETKRKNGEWFDLSPAEVKAFKRWRRIT